MKNRPVKLRTYLRKVLILAIALVLIGGAWLTYALTRNGTSSSKGNNTHNNSGPADGTTVTLEGKVVCLPHKDTGGPQTLECAFGLQTDEGTYYALRDSSAGSSAIGQLGTDQNVKVIGTFKDEPSDKYQDIGTITVGEIEVLE